METRLAPGEHRFEYRPRTVNCYPAEWTEAIPAGTEAYALAHRLALRPATLIVDTAGVEATVDVLERRAGRANEPIEIPFEAHEGVEITLRVAITFAGRPPLRRDVKVRAGDSVTITVPPPASGAAGADGGETDRGPE
jgi:hypothetical protein